MSSAPSAGARSGSRDQDSRAGRSQRAEAAVHRFQIERLELLLGSPPGRYSRRMSQSTSIIGRWRITEMDNWDQEAVDLVQPGFIEFDDDDGVGGLGFIAVRGELDCRDADRDGRPGVEFSWQGSDEGDDVCGRGSAALTPMARSRATSTSTLVMTPRSGPSDSAQSSGERPRRSRDGKVRLRGDGL
jgi:hypothetical protein